MARRVRQSRDKQELTERPLLKPVSSERSRAERQPDRVSLDAANVRRNGLPAHSTAGSLNRATVLQMQQRFGNTAVQRYLASSKQARDRQAVQRQPKPEKTKAGVALGSKELAFKADLNLSSDGKLRLDLGPSLNLKMFGLSARASIKPTALMGVGELRLGGKGHYLAPKVVVGTDGKATLELGHRFKRDLFSMSTTLKTGKGKTTVGQTLGWTNPFGLERADVKAVWQYGLTGEKSASAKLAAGYTILGSEKDKNNPVLKLIIEGSYQSTGTDPAKREAKGMLYLVGRF